MSSSVCRDCGKATKGLGQRCHSCVRKKQWTDGIFNANRIDKTTNTRWCSICSAYHPWIYEQSNEHWLVRKNKGYIRYECRINRKNKYLRNKQDPQKRLRKSVSNLIRDCINKHQAFKNGSFPKYVTWTIEELKQHLENQFVDGMSWDNYGKGIGKWSIDHVIPDSHFTYSTMYDEGFIKSWSLDNLQPMWDIDNCAKGNNINYKKEEQDV